MPHFCLAHALTVADRERVGCEASPTGGILDAQAARSGGGGVKGARGYDPARRLVGRKRHALTDTDGRLLLATVSPADLHVRSFRGLLHAWNTLINRPWRIMSIGWRPWAMGSNQ